MIKFAVWISYGRYNMSGKYFLFVCLVQLLLLGSAVPDSAGLHAQTKDAACWSLGACVDYAIENNISIAQEEIALARSKNDLQESYLDLVPSVSGGISHSLNWGRSVNVQELKISRSLTLNTSASIDARLTVFSGLSKQNTIKSRKMALKLETENYQRLKDEISIDVANSYLQVLLYYEINELSKKSCEASAQKAANTKVLVDEGSEPYSTYLEMQAKAAQDSLQLVNSGNNLSNAYLALAQLLNLSIEQQKNFRVEIPKNDDLLITPDDLNFNEIYNDALGLPKIRMNEFALEKSKIDLKIAKGNYYPQLSVSATYGTYYTDSQKAAFFSQFNDNKNPYLGISLNIPIFSGLKTRINTDNARLNVQNSQYNLDRAKQELYKEVQSVYFDVLNSYRRYQAAKSSAEASHESWQVVDFKAQEGAATTTEVIVAMNNWFSSASECVQAKYQYLLFTKILDFYRGIPIR